jgi:hypothetical protein
MTTTNVTTKKERREGALDSLAGSRVFNLQERRPRHNGKNEDYYCAAA